MKTLLFRAHYTTKSGDGGGFVSFSTKSTRRSKIFKKAMELIKEVSPDSKITYIERID